MTDRCQVPRCRGEVELIYVEHGICSDHWNQFTADGVPADQLRMVLGIGPEASDATEEDMAATKATTTKKKATTKPKAARPKKVKPPKEELCVFACRVSEPERVKFHKATGPAGASRFARKLMVVFSGEDEAGFRALLKEAREARA